MEFQEVSAISLSLMNSTAVILIVGYFLTRSQFYDIMAVDKPSLRQLLLLILIFGVFSIYGTVSGIKLNDGVIANIRDLGPMLAGLIAGPVAGLAAGLIGGIHRYTLGGYTQMACSISTVMAGLLGGLAFQFNHRRFIGIKAGMILMAVMECIHMGMALLLGSDFATSLDIVANVSVPMIIANSLGLGLFFYFVQNVEESKALYKAKQFMEGELKVARDIQMSIIPRSFPAYPERPEFELHALLEPAREVGGDFYDFFFLDDERLFMVIGDVSGKGVPASLFMAVTRTLLRSKAQQTDNPEQIMVQVNRELCQENDSAMFVTIFSGIMNIQNGNLQYCNAGHNPPFIIGSDGLIRKVKRGGDMALGIVSDNEYHRMETVLAPGETLLLYTDGVTEAMNAREELLGTSRMISFLSNKNQMQPAGLIDALQAFVREFEAGAPASDDVTMLAVKKHQNKRGDS